MYVILLNFCVLSRTPPIELLDIVKLDLMALSQQNIVLYLLGYHMEAYRLPYRFNYMQIIYLTLTVSINFADTR